MVWREAHAMEMQVGPNFSLQAEVLFRPASHQLRGSREEELLTSH